MFLRIRWSRLSSWRLKKVQSQLLQPCVNMSVALPQCPTNMRPFICYSVWFVLQETKATRKQRSMRLLLMRSGPGQMPWTNLNCSTFFSRYWGILFVLKFIGKPLLFWRALAKLLLPPLAMDLLHIDLLLTHLSKALPAFDAWSGGMFSLHVVITRWESKWGPAGHF